MKTKRQIRHKRVRAKVFGTRQKPRLSVYRSNKHLFLQLIDDESGKTILSVSDKELEKPRRSPKAKSESRPRSASGKSDRAYEAGKLLADKAKAKKIQKVVFDRGGYKYHGRVRRVAEGAREGGLNF